MGNSLRTHKELQEGLVSAASRGVMDEVRILIQHGADPNCGQRTVKGTALHAAVRNSDVNMCHFLLEAGADPNAVDKSGQRAVDLAVAIANEVAKASVVGFKDYSRAFSLATDETLLQERADMIESLLTKYDKERAIQLLHSRLHDSSPQVVDADVHAPANHKRDVRSKGGGSHAARMGRMAKRGSGQELDSQAARRTRTPSPSESRSSSASRASKDSEELGFKTPSQLSHLPHDGVIYSGKEWNGISVLEKRLYGTSPVA